MNEQEYVNEILDNIQQYNLPIIESEETIPDLTCSASKHSEDTSIREGNRINAVLKKTDEVWECVGVVCWHCSVSDIFQKISGGDPTAVVCGRVEKPPVHANCTDGFYLNDADVWEIQVPHQEA